jgi:hypothetical protein
LGLPEIGAGQYLVDAMFKMRPLRASGFGSIPADWPVIDAFARGTGRVSEPWEIEALFEMCQAYSQGLDAGIDPLAIAPTDQIEAT